MNTLEESIAPPTRFDVCFRLGDIPVRIHPFFWLTTALLGLHNRGSGVDQMIHLLIWVAIVFVSILVHELGHVLMGRWFGVRGHIVLTGFCGLAIGSADLRRRWQRNLVSLAGPAAGFLLAALAIGVFWLIYPSWTLAILGLLFGIIVIPSGPDIFNVPPEYVFSSMFYLMWINIFWGLVNLLPIWPLDGGQISRETCEHYRGRDGLRLALIISLAVAAGLALLALFEVITKKPLIPFLSLGDSLFSVLFFALLALANGQLLYFLKRAGPDWDEGGSEPRAPWEQDPDWWKHGDDPWRD
ncbi:MAG: site-2 protease family protein [Gemmataceae bacterium]|nr:site-2 protease family protein [Gemmataceae bacterium]MCI0737698.1 site-2 protease family protein [Gemmataceae bacterium]